MRQQRYFLQNHVCVSCPLTPMYCCSNAGSRLGEGVARRITQRVLSGWVPDTTVCSPRRLTSVYCRIHYLHKKKYACFQPFVFIYFVSLITYETLEIHEPNEYYSPTVLRYQYLTETLLAEKICPAEYPKRRNYSQSTLSPEPVICIVLYFF